MEESALVVVVWVAGECAYPHTHTYGYIYAAVVRLPPASTTGTTIADFLNSWGERAEKKGDDRERRTGQQKQNKVKKKLSSGADHNYF